MTVYMDNDYKCHVAPAADTVSFYATDKPTVALNVQLKAVRK